MVTIGSSKEPVRKTGRNQNAKRDEEIIFSEAKEAETVKDETRKPRRYDRPKKRED